MTLEGDWPTWRTTAAHYQSMVYEIWTTSSPKVNGLVQWFCASHDSIYAVSASHFANESDTILFSTPTKNPTENDNSKWWNIDSGWNPLLHSLVLHTKWTPPYFLILLDLIPWEPGVLWITPVLSRSQELASSSHDKPNKLVIWLWESSMYGEALCCCRN